MKFNPIDENRVPITSIVAKRAHGDSRFDKLKGCNRQGWAALGFNSTDEIMNYLRGYNDDANDPGFALLATTSGRKRRP